MDSSESYRVQSLTHLLSSNTNHMQCILWRSECIIFKFFCFHTRSLSNSWEHKKKRCNRCVFSVRWLKGSLSLVCISHTKNDKHWLKLSALTMPDLWLKSNRSDAHCSFFWQLLLSDWNVVLFLCAISGGFICLFWFVLSNLELSPNLKPKLAFE